MLTIKLPYTASKEDKEYIKELQKKQSPMIRSAYVAAMKVNKATTKDIESLLKNRFDGQLDSWYIRCAAYSGIGSSEADKALGITKRTFGSRKEFNLVSKGLITNEEWKESRFLPLYIIGEAIPNGNRKFDFKDYKNIIFKPFRGTKIHISLPKLRSNYKRTLTALFESANQKKQPITISLTDSYICITFDETKLDLSKKKNPIQNRYAGIDLNPNYIGVSVFQDERIISTKLVSLKELTGKGINENKLEFETSNIGHEIGRWLIHLRVDKVFIESLNFKSGSMGLGKGLNRLCKNQWKRKTFTDSLKKYFKLYDINAAYTSTIGNVLHPELPDPVAASTEIASRGYRLVICKNKQFYPELPQKKDIEDRWKKPDVPDFVDWKELHCYIKETRIKYRVDIPDISMFRIFKASKSQIFTLDDFIYEKFI